MSEYCFALIYCDKEMRRSVVDQLKQIHSMTKIEELDNEQEIRVKIVAETKDHLREIIAMKIQKMTCVTSVKTIM
ncbi:MAG: hypothetical protein ACE5DU_08880 [Nitrosopumilus sp.]